MIKDKKYLKELLKFNKKHLERIDCSIKKMKVDDELLDLKAEVNFYKLNETLGYWHDGLERKEQRRRLWMISILEHKQDDKFLKRLGLIHISKINKGEIKNDK